MMNWTTVPLLSRVCIHDFPIRWFIQTYLFVKKCACIYLMKERKEKGLASNNNHVYHRNINICVDFILSFLLIRNECYFTRIKK